NSQLRVRALQEIALMRDAEAFDEAVDIVGGWSRDERREGVKVLLQALAERSIGRRDQANAWLWRLAEYTREVHEEYAVQRSPESCSATSRRDAAGAPAGAVAARAATTTAPRPRRRRPRRSRAPRPKPRRAKAPRRPPRSPRRSRAARDAAARSRSPSRQR